MIGGVEGLTIQAAETDILKMNSKNKIFFLWKLNLPMITEREYLVFKIFSLFKEEKLFPGCFSET